MRDVISGCACVVCVLLRFDKKLFYRCMLLEPIATFIVMHMCCCAIGCQHSTLNRLFGSVWFMVWLCFPGMTSSLANHRCTLSDVFSTMFLFFDVPQ